MSDQPVSAGTIALATSILERHGRKPTDGGFTMVDARAAETLQKMEDRQIDMDVKRRLLIHRDKALSKIFDAARKERDAWLQWVPRSVAEIAAELKKKGAPVDPQALETTLDEFVRRHLAQLAEFAIEI